MSNLDFATLLLLHEECDLDEEVLLFDLTGEEQRPAFRFDVDKFNSYECRTYFRFEKEHLDILRAQLGIPRQITCYNGTTVAGLDALCVVLRRLAYPNKLVDLVPIFGRAKEEISIIFNTTIDIIYNLHKDKLHNLDQEWITPDRFAGAIANKGAPLNNIWGFVEATLHAICRPKYHEQTVFNGRQQIHSLKFQSVICPNGLIADLYGPIKGRKRNSALLKESTLIQRMECCPKYQIYAVYGDPKYPLQANIVVPFRGEVLTAEQQHFNQSMSDIQDGVEWSFCDIIQEFAFLDVKRNLKLYLQPIGKMYIVAALLVNCQTCLYGNQISRYFDVKAPSLEAYLNGT